MEIVESNVITIFVIGSIGSDSDRLFFDTLNIQFSDQESMYKVYSNDYSYKGKDYKYVLHFISGERTSLAVCLVPVRIVKLCDTRSIGC